MLRKKPKKGQIVYSFTAAVRRALYKGVAFRLGTDDRLPWYWVDDDLTLVAGSIENGQRRVSERADFDPCTILSTDWRIEKVSTGKPLHKRTLPPEHFNDAVAEWERQTKLYEEQTKKRKAEQ